MASSTVTEIATIAPSHGESVRTASGTKATTGMCHRYSPYERSPIQRSGARLSSVATSVSGATAAARTAIVATVSRARPHVYRDIEPSVVETTR